MRVMSATIMIAPITTGPTGSWNGTVDRFAIILPRQMNVYVAYKLSSTDAVSIVSAMINPALDPVFRVSASVASNDRPEA